MICSQINVHCCGCVAILVMITLGVVPSVAGETYGWGFKLHFLYATIFWCEFDGLNKKTLELKVFDARNNERRTYNYRVREDGFYLNNSENVNDSTNHPSLPGERSIPTLYRKDICYPPQ